MILDILLFGAIALGVQILGSTVLRYFDSDRLKFSLSHTLIFGFAIILFATRVGISLGSKFQEYSFSFLIGFIFFVLVLAKLSGRSILAAIFSDVREFKSFLWQVSPLIILTSISLNSSVMGSGLRMRVGPDPIGTLSVAKFYCENDSLVNLENRIQAQLQNSSIDQILNAHSHYTLPSYADQINLEWIVGAKRTTISSLLAQYCSDFSPSFIVHSYVALILFATFLILVLIREYLINSGITKFSTNLVMWTATLNVNLSFVIYESGISQVVVLPYFLSLLFAVARRGAKEKYLFDSILSIFCVLSVSVTTYPDLLLISILPIFLVFFGKYGLATFRKAISLEKSTKNLLALCLVLLHVPYIAQLGYFFIRRSKDATSGGWNQGGFPLLAEYFGILNWLPDDGLNARLVTPGMVFLSVLFSIGILYLLYKLKMHEFAFNSILFWMATFTVVYMGLAGGSGLDSYLIIKAGAYFSLGLIPIMVAKSFVTTPVVEHSRHWMHNSLPRARNRIRLGVLILCLTSILSGIDWRLSWASSSHQTIYRVDSKISDILEKSDVLYIGNNKLKGLPIVLMGNANFVYGSRGHNLPSGRRPNTELVFFKYGRECSSFPQINFQTDTDWAPKLNSAKPLYSNGQFCFWRT